jgi:hypothetical protein
MAVVMMIRRYQPRKRTMHLINQHGVIMGNAQNTPRRLIDSSNTVVWAWDSTAFGVEAG